MKALQEVTEDQTDDDHLYIISEHVYKKPEVNVVAPEIYRFKLNNNFVPLEIDSGACVSLISEKLA